MSESQAIKRVVLIIMDSVGIGELPDASLYGDAGSHTLKNIAKVCGPLHIPNLSALGLGNIVPIPGIEPAAAPLACFGRMAERSPGKDTTTGHWEIAGLVLPRAFPTFPDGFPAEFIRAFEERVGRKTLGNETASGTEIIQRLGDEQVRTGALIVYTSADSVFQIAAHEESVTVDELMAICRIAREMLTGKLEVSRVIARPFLGKSGAYVRTPNRHDFSIKPMGPTLLDHVSASGQSVLAVGKISDVFAGRGITEAFLTKSNQEGMAQILACIAMNQPGLVMANLIDFDMLYGHRNDAEGYARALEEMDAWLPTLWHSLGQEDLLILTADHGCDPTMPGTDHSREYVPILVYGAGVRAGVDLGIRPTFADLGATAAHYLLGREGILAYGQSFWGTIRKKR